MRADDAGCPFCGAFEVRASRPTRSVARRSRATLLGVTALCAAAAGCYESHRRPRDGEVAQDAGAPVDPCPEDDPGCSVALYGGPAPADVIV